MSERFHHGHAGVCVKYNFGFLKQKKFIISKI